MDTPRDNLPEPKLNILQIVKLRKEMKRTRKKNFVNI